MNKISDQLLEKILLESSIDVRVESGIINLKNSDHALVVVEKLYNANVDLDLINEFSETYVTEGGKYPERQAFNKDGWLVTFPSQQYKQAAIKRGTHFPSDPTHGNGGMNTYYKKKGKQKRNTQQDTSSTGATQSVSSKAPVGQEPATASVSSASKAEPQNKSAAQIAREKLAGLTSQADAEDSAEASQDTGSTSPTDKPAPDTGKAPTDTAQPKAEPVPSTASSPTPAPAPVQKPYVFLSTEFAQSKNWSPTPYGEWRNESGEPMAVVALSKEVVPIRSNDRDELRLFVEKKTK